MAVGARERTGNGKEREWERQPAPERTGNGNEKGKTENVNG